jgi:hypothetical protein
MPVLPFGPYGLNISILLVSIMLIIGGLLLGLGYALEDRKLKEIGKNELFQSLINGALVGGFLVLFVNGGVIDSFLNSLVLSNGTSISCSSFLQGNSAICFAYNYLVGPNQYYYMGSYHSSVLSSLSIIIISLVSLYAVLGVFRLFISPVLAQIQSAVQILGTAAVSATVQASVLAFIAVSALTVLLPLGLILRSFYATRKTGSFLIALTIGLYLVFPLSYLMNATIASYYGFASTGTGLSTLTLNVSGIKSSTLSYVSEGTNGSGIVPALENVGNQFAVQASDLMSNMFDLVAYFILYTFVMPAFSLMLTAISVKEMAAFLGSDNFFGKFNLL